MTAPEPSSPGADRPGVGWFQWVADQSGSAFFILRVRPDLAFEFLTEGALTRLTGRSPGHTPAARAVLDGVHPDSADILAAMLALPPGRGMSANLRWCGPGGRPIDLRGWVGATVRPDGSAVLEGMMQDITALRDADLAVRRSEERHRLLAESAWDVVWTMDVDGTVTDISRAVGPMRGFSPEQTVRQSLRGIQSRDSGATLAEYLRRLRNAGEPRSTPAAFRGEVQYRTEDGSVVTGEVRLIPRADRCGRVVELLGVTRDVSDRKRVETALTRLAGTDPVTGLWNRRRATEILSLEVETARRGRYPVAMLMLDIDHFKTVNDTHGHQAGDLILAEVARLLREHVRHTDMVARWGGEEFVVLLRHCNRRGAMAAAESLRIGIAGRCRVTVSIGVAELATGDDLAGWLHRADSGLYRAKRAGRNSVAPA